MPEFSQFFPATLFPGGGEIQPGGKKLKKDKRILVFRMLKKYLSLVKFSHTIFAMPFALIGYFLAIVQNPAIEFKGWIFLSVILCMVFARNAAMGFNRYLDRHIDKQNPRTAKREIPAGKISPRSAMFFVALNCILFVFTTFFINRLVFFLSPVALGVVLGYSYTKRFTPLSHFVLGAGLALAPIGAYLAVAGFFSLLPLLFSFAVFFWVAGFDIIYALQDENFDKTQKLKSIPAQIGKKRALQLSVAAHALSAGFIVYAGFYAGFGEFYWLGSVVYCGLLFYQHLIVKPNDLRRVSLAFFTTNGIASLIFAFFTIVELYSSSLL